MTDINAGALDALRNGQQQLDGEGVFVGVSRQALDELLAWYDARPATDTAVEEDEQRYHDDTPEGITKRARHYASTTLDPLAYEIERILFRRVIQKRLDGYTKSTAAELAEAARIVFAALSPTTIPQGAAEGLAETAINQNDAMRQELAHIGNLVSDLARASGVDQADADGSWPCLAGRVTKLIDAAKLRHPTADEGDALELEELRFWLSKANTVLAPHSADAPGTPTRDALVFVNAGLFPQARERVRAHLKGPDHADH